MKIILILCCFLKFVCGLFVNVGVGNFFFLFMFLKLFMGGMLGILLLILLFLLVFWFIMLFVILMGCISICLFDMGLRNRLFILLFSFFKILLWGIFFVRCVVWILGFFFIFLLVLMKDINFVLICIIKLY